MDNSGFYFKSLLATVFAAVSLRLEGLNKLLWLFVAAVALDYVTGVFAAACQRNLSSGTGLRGIVKKVGECVVIAVAFIADEVVALSGAQIGVAISTGGAIATIVTIWLILNELISILENLSEINVPLPSFLPAAIRLLKNQTENKAEKINE